MIPDLLLAFALGLLAGALVVWLWMVRPPRPLKRSEFDDLIARARHRCTVVDFPRRPPPGRDAG